MNENYVISHIKSAPGAIPNFNYLDNICKNELFLILFMEFLRLLRNWLISTIYML